MNGTGLVVCAVCGPPVSGSIIISQLPWSAVTNSRAPAFSADLEHASETLVDRLDRA